MMTFVVWLGPTLEVGILAGLAVRGRIGRLVMLPCLLLSLIASATVVGVCDSCNTWTFWLAKEIVHAAFLLGLAVELVVRLGSTATRRAAGYWLAFVLAAMTVLVITAPHGLLIVEVLPRVLGAIAWLYMGLLVVMLRYDVRIEPLHDAILSGFTPYLMVYAATWSHAATDTSIVKYVNPVMFVFVLLLLLRAAWQRDAPQAPLWVRRSYRSGPREPPSSSSPRSCRAGLHADAPDLA